MFISTRTVYLAYYAGILRRAFVKLLSWVYVRQAIYFGAYGTSGVSIFGVFVSQAFINVARIFSGAGALIPGKS